MGQVEGRRLGYKRQTHQGLEAQTMTDKDERLVELAKKLRKEARTTTEPRIPSWTSFDGTS